MCRETGSKLNAGGDYPGGPFGFFSTRPLQGFVLKFTFSMLM
jgi:hypothetical protein